MARWKLTVSSPGISMNNVLALPQRLPQTVSKCFRCMWNNCLPLGRRLVCNL